MADRAGETGEGPTLRVPDQADRDDLGAFTARLVRLDPVAAVRLRARADGAGDAAEPHVEAWAQTPFGVLVTRAVRGVLRPPDVTDVTVTASDLLTGLAVQRSAEIDLGRSAELAWRGALPPRAGWRALESVPAAELEELTGSGLALAREHAGPLGPPASLLDQTVLTVERTDGDAARVPMRCLFALSGMGFLGSSAAGDRVHVSASGHWLRLDARYGAVVREARPSIVLA